MIKHISLDLWNTLLVSNNKFSIEYVSDNDKQITSVYFDLNEQKNQTGTFEKIENIGNDSFDR